MMAPSLSGKVRGVKWPAQSTILAGFGLALLILMAIGVVSYQSTLNVEAAAALRAHSDQVRFGIQALLSQLQDAETGQRGFIITGDETYLAPYNTAVTAVQNQAASLRALTANDPAQQQQLDALDPLIAAQLTALQQTIDLRRAQGFQAAQALVLTDTGQQTMDQIRRVLGNMLAEEDRPNPARDAPLSRDLLTVRGVLIGGGALAGGMVLLAVAFIQRELRRRHVAEAALASEHDLLQILMDNIPDTLYFKDRQSRFVRINRAQAQVLGLPDPAAATGKTDFDFQREDVSRLSFAREQEILASGQALIDWIEYVPTPSGAPRWFSSTKTPIRDAAGQVTGLVGLSRDVTAHQQAQAALETEIAERKRPRKKSAR
jgi:PAS domain S-box-containing protein